MFEVLDGLKGAFTIGLNILDEGDVHWRMERKDEKRSLIWQTDRCYVQSDTSTPKGKP